MHVLGQPGAHRFRGLSPRPIVDRRADVGTAHQPLERARLLAPGRSGDVPARRLVPELLQVALERRRSQLRIGRLCQRARPSRPLGRRRRHARQQLGHQRRRIEPAPTQERRQHAGRGARVRLHDPEQRLVDRDERLQRLLQRRRRPREALSRRLPHAAQGVGRADRRRLRPRIGRVEQIAADHALAQTDLALLVDQRHQTGLRGRQRQRVVGGVPVPVGVVEVAVFRR